MGSWKICVGPAVRRTSDASDQWCVGSAVRRTSGAWDQRCVGPAVRRTSGMSPVLSLKYKAKCFFFILCGILADLEEPNVKKISPHPHD